MADRPSSSVQLGWQDGFKFVSQDTHAHTVTVDAPQSEGDSFDGMMPGDLLLTSLGSCSGIDVVNILRRQRQEVTGLEISVRGEQLPDAPWTWVAINIEYTVRGRGLRESAVRSGHRIVGGTLLLDWRDDRRAGGDYQQFHNC